MLDNYEVLKKYTVRELFGTVVRKLYEKKAVRLAASAVAVFAAAYASYRLIGNVNREEWLTYVVQTLLFIVLITGIAVLISNIGKFTKRKYVITAAAATVILWAATAALGECWTIDFAYADLLPKAIGTALLFYIPIFIFVFATVLFLAWTVLRRGKKQS